MTLIADKNNQGSFDFEGFIEAILYIRFSLDHFYNIASKYGKENLSFEALKECLPWMGVNNADENESYRLFQLADADNSGEVDPEEFLIIAIRLREPQRSALIN